MSTESWIFVFAGTSALADFLTILRLLGVFGVKSESESRINASKKKWPLPVLLFVLTMGLCGYGFYRVHKLESELAKNDPVIWNGQHKEVVKGKQFINQEVELDNRSFIECTFESATLVYRGAGPFDLIGNHFVGVIKIDVKGNPGLGGLIMLERELKQFNSSVRFID